MGKGSDESLSQLGADALLGVDVEIVDLPVQLRRQIPGIPSIALGQEDAALAHLLHLLPTLGFDLLRRASIPLGPTVLQPHPQRLTEPCRGITFLVDHTQPLEERPPGGLGIYLIRQYMDEAIHRITPQGGNELILKKGIRNRKE